MSRRRTSPLDRIRSNWRRLWGEPIGWVWLSAFLLHIVALLWIQNLVFFNRLSPDQHGIFIAKSMRFYETEKKELLDSKPVAPVEFRPEIVPIPSKTPSKVVPEKKVQETAPVEVPSWNPMDQPASRTEAVEKPPVLATVGVKIWDLQSPVKKVVFLIDVSGTMWNEIEGKWGFQVAQEEVEKSIRFMPPEMEFNVIYYSDSTAWMSKGLVSANPENKERARRFLSLIPSLNGGTDFFKGLRDAFEQKPEAVFIFTDGEIDIARWKVPSRFDDLREKTSQGIRLFGVGFFYEKNQESLDLLQKLCFLCAGDFRLYNRYTPSVKVDKKEIRK